jgi:ActR/RegA family two-component response regulator
MVVSLAREVSAFVPALIRSETLFRVSPTPAWLQRWHSERVKRSMLVVDDDLAVPGLMVRILRSRGHAVVGEAGSVAEALDRAERLRPNIGLVDMGVPDGDGFSKRKRFVRSVRRCAS